MSHSISTPVPEPSAPGRGHAVGATAGQWPEKKPIWPDRRLVDLLGIEHPLVLAPMAGLGTVELAASVCAGGGLGSLGCVGLPPERVTQAVDKLRTLTDKPINTNFFCHNATRADPAREANWRDRLAPYYNELRLDPSLAASQSEILPFDDALCRVVERVKPEIVSFHFGLPEPALLARVKAAGCRVMGSATTVAEARWLEARGADVIIAQGCEAGGHRGMFLKPGGGGCVSAEHAGPGATDRRCRRRADYRRGWNRRRTWDRGCLCARRGGGPDRDGLPLCPEAALPPLCRDALRQARADTTVLTNVFTGRPARALSNRLTRELGPLHGVTPDFPTPMLALTPLRRKAEQQGSREFSPHWRGKRHRWVE